MAESDASRDVLRVVQHRCLGQIRWAGRKEPPKWETMRCILVHQSDTLREHRKHRCNSQNSNGSNQVTIPEFPAASATGRVLLVGARRASGLIVRPRSHETAWTRNDIPTAVQRACSVCNAFRPPSFVLLANMTPAWAAGRPAMAVWRAAADHPRAEVPDIDGAGVVERDASHSSAASAFCGLALDISNPLFISF